MVQHTRNTLLYKPQIEFDYARSSKNLTPHQKKELDTILKKYSVQIREAACNNQFSKEKEEVFTILVLKGYRDISDILKNSNVMIFPSDISKEIKKIEQHHSITIYALNTIIEKKQYILLSSENNRNDQEIKRSIIHEAFALSTSSHEYNSKIEEDILDNKKLEEILNWPSVRSTNLTTYKERYRILISELYMLLGRKRDFTVADFGCGFDSEEFIPVSLIEIKKALDPHSDRGVRFVAVDQINPYYVLSGKNEIPALVYDSEKRLIAYQSKAGHLVDCQGNLEMSFRITKNRKEEREYVLKNRGLYESLLQIKLGNSIMAVSESIQEASKYTLIIDPLSRVRDEGIEFICNPYFGIDKQEQIDVGIVYNVFLHYAPDDVQKYFEILALKIKEGGYLIAGDVLDHFKKSVKEEIMIYKKENGILNRYKFIFWVKPGFGDRQVELTNCNVCLNKEQQELLNPFFTTKEYYDSGEILGYESFNPGSVVERLRRRLGIVAVLHEKEAVLVEFDEYGNFKKLPKYSSQKEPPDIVESIREIRRWKDNFKNQPVDNEYMRELKRIAMDLYNHNRIYRLPIRKRMAFFRVIFDQHRFAIVNAAVMSIYRALTDRKLACRIDPEDVLYSIQPDTYHILANRLSVFESRCSMIDNRNIRFAINVILFDFLRNGEKRLSELLWLVEEIDKELIESGSSTLPVIIAMQDLHGGARRALSLVGHALGLDKKVYHQVHTIKELRLALEKRDIKISSMDIRFVGMNDKYDRGENPGGIFELVKWLRETGKAKTFIGNHDFWRLLSVLGVHLIPGVSMEKSHGVGFWASDAMKHAGWGTIELDEINQYRFNREIDRANIIVKLFEITPLCYIDLGEFRANINNEMKRLKKLNAEIRRENELNKDNPEYKRKDEHALPDIFTQTLSFLRTQVVDRNSQISTINAEYGLDIKPVVFQEVNLDNYMDDTEIVFRTLWELQNFRLFYIDVLGNIHLHNILPMDFDHRCINVTYKGSRGIPALEMMQEDVRNFFENMTTIPNSEAFRKKMWEALGEAFTEINRWYSDKEAHAKPVSVKRFLECGGPAGFGGELLGASVKQFADRQSTFMMVIGHNERKKFDDPGTPLPWIMLSPETGSGIANIDYELSQGYRDRGAYLSIFARDDNGAITGIRKWGYPDPDFEPGVKIHENSIIKDITLTDIKGLTPEQTRMLQELSDGKKFMTWYRLKALAEIHRILTILIEESGRLGRFNKEEEFKKKQIDIDKKIAKLESAVI